jgi:hypothetical protein
MSTFRFEHLGIEESSCLDVGSRHSKSRSNDLPQYLSAVSLPGQTDWANISSSFLISCLRLRSCQPSWLVNDPQGRGLYSPTSNGLRSLPRMTSTSQKVACPRRSKDTDVKHLHCDVAELPVWWVRVSEAKRQGNDGCDGENRNGLVVEHEASGSRTEFELGAAMKRTEGLWMARKARWEPGGGLGLRTFGGRGKRRRV